MYTKEMKYPFFILVAFFSFCSCTANDDFEKDNGRVVPQEMARDKIYNILIIGNSLARDAFCYVPPIMEEICPDLMVNMKIMYVSGNPLKTHWNYIAQKKAKFVCDVYTSYSGAWTSSSGWFADDIVSSYSWNLVVFQEGSVNARTYDNSQPYVSNIIEFVESIQPNSTFAYTIIPSLPDGASSLGESTSDEIWAMNVETAKKLLDNGIVSFLLPCGTGIQNARKTSLDNYGDFGHLTYDGRHLQEGIPCVVDAYTATESILRIMEIDSTIENSKLRVTQKWINLLNVLGPHGMVLEGSDIDYSLARRCALLAIEYPYEISIP